MKYPPTMGLPVASPVVRRRGWNSSSMAGLAVGLVAVIVVGALVAGQLNRRPTATHSGLVTTGAANSGSDHSSPLPFNCLGSTSLARGPAPKLAYVQGVGVEPQAGYDRLTIQFTDGPPGLSELITQDRATFTGAGGQTVTLGGRAGALLTLHTSDGHTHYGGPADLKTGAPMVLEVRKIEDGAGEVQWAVGLSLPGCYRMVFVDQPTRLIVDFQAGRAA